MRYEHQLNRVDGTATSALFRREAHVLSSHASFQPALPWVFSGEVAAKFATERSNGFRTRTDAQLLATRALFDFSERWDAGLIARVLLSDGFSERQGGLGVELGRVVAKNLRVGAGFNLFGFRDTELSGQNSTDRGVYLLLGWKFDEALFGVDPPPSAVAPEVTP
jgi:hypothetical protein